MKYGIISDIHANAAALRAVLQECDRQGIDQIVCAGDVVGYGPDPAEVIRILRDRDVPTVMGNHDAAVAGAWPLEGMIGSAQAGVCRHREELSASEIEWLRGLPYVYEGDGFVVCHANFYEPEQMRYIHDVSDARASLYRMCLPLLFVGHTHNPDSFSLGMPSSKAKFPECIRDGSRDFMLRNDWRYLVNAGSVGYPRVRPYSSFVTFDSNVRKVSFNHVEFDFLEYAESLYSKGIAIPPWVIDHAEC